MKNKATQQITRLRLELENNHVLELRGLRESYEQEKSYLQDELSRLQSALIESNRTTNATAFISSPSIPVSSDLAFDSQINDKPILYQSRSALKDNQDLSHNKLNSIEKTTENKVSKEDPLVDTSNIDYQSIRMIELDLERKVNYNYYYNCKNYIIILFILLKFHVSSRKNDNRY